MNNSQEPRIIGLMINNHWMERNHFSQKITWVRWLTSRQLMFTSDKRLKTPRVVTD